MKNIIKKYLLMTTVLGLVLTGCDSAKEPVDEEIVVENIEETMEESVETEESIDLEAQKTVEAKEYYEKGRSFLYGMDGKEINLEEAYNNFMKALELGNTDANFYLGLLSHEYNYPKQDYAAAKAYYEVDENNLYAQINLGLMYLDGKGVEKDVEKAKSIFQSVIDQECVEGYMGMGCIADEEKSYEAAYENYNKVLEEKEPYFMYFACNQIGWLYQNGFGVEQDYSLAMEYFEKSFDLGSPVAMNNIGWSYQNGFGVEQDYTLAFEWYMKSANLGCFGGINNIGWFYLNGLGIEQDYSLAMDYFKKGADLGDSAAMNNIGWIYENGLGVEQDYELAFEWYMKAAELEDSTAIFNIGAMYCDGLGVEQNYELALEWLERAVEMGEKDAQSWIDYIKDVME